MKSGLIRSLEIIIHAEILHVGFFAYTYGLSNVTFFALLFISKVAPNFDNLNRIFCAYFFLAHYWSLIYKKCDQKVNSLLKTWIQKG